MKLPGRLACGAAALMVAYPIAMALGAERLGCWDPAVIVGPYGQIDEVLHCGEEFAMLVPLLAFGMLVAAGVLKIARVFHR